MSIQTPPQHVLLHALSAAPAFSFALFTTNASGLSPCRDAWHAWPVSSPGWSRPPPRGVLKTTSASKSSLQEALSERPVVPSAVARFAVLARPPEEDLPWLPATPGLCFCFGHSGSPDQWPICPQSLQVDLAFCLRMASKRAPSALAFGTALLPYLRSLALLASFVRAALMVTMQSATCADACSISSNATAVSSSMPVSSTIDAKASSSASRACSTASPSSASSTGWSEPPAGGGASDCVSDACSPSSVSAAFTDRDREGVEDEPLPLWNGFGSWPPPRSRSWMRGKSAKSFSCTSSNFVEPSRADSAAPPSHQRGLIFQ